jgi:hypothetical protein
MELANSKDSCCYCIATSIAGIILACTADINDTEKCFACDVYMGTVTFIKFIYILLDGREFYHRKKTKDMGV